LKGMAMGAADSVPGVSGGTIAVIARIYDELIFSIRSINLAALRVLYKDGIARAWDYINGSFLLALFIGIVVSLRLSAGLVLYLLENHFEPLMAFFIGLVFASCWSLKAEFRQRTLGIAVALLCGMAVTLLVGLMSPQTGTASGIYLFFCGLVAICAMILPGLSGAFLLLVLGVYDYVLTAVIELNLTIIFIFVSGCGLGLLLFSRVLAWTLSRYRDLSYAFLTGMLLASIEILWPWQMATSTFVDLDGHITVLQSSNVSPSSYMQVTGQEPQFLAVCVTLVAGFLLIFGFDKLFRKSID